MKYWILNALAICVLLFTSMGLHADVGPDTRGLAPREIHEEADPEYEEACLSMGRMTIDYASGETGVPKAGFRITDPRGRKIGYDPRTKSGWQEMPLAQASLECEENEENGELKQCKDHVEICGPVSGTYRVELLPSHSGKYSITVSATSKTTRSEFGSATTSSRANLKGEVRKQERTELLLHYCREPGTQVELMVSDQRSADRHMPYNRPSVHVNRPSTRDISAQR